MDVFAAFDFEIVYIRGKRNKADSFSRRPDLMKVKEQGWREHFINKSNILSSQLSGKISESSVTNKSTPDDYDYI